MARKFRFCRSTRDGLTIGTGSEAQVYNGKCCHRRYQRLNTDFGIYLVALVNRLTVIFLLILLWTVV